LDQQYVQQKRLNAASYLITTPVQKHILAPEEHTVCRNTIHNKPKLRRSGLFI